MIYPPQQDPIRKRTVTAYLLGCVAVAVVSALLTRLGVGRSPELAKDATPQQVQFALALLLASGAAPLLVAGAVVAWFAPAAGLRHAFVFGLLFNVLGLIIVPLSRLLARKPMSPREIVATAGMGVVALLAALLGGWIAVQVKRRVVRPD